MPSYQYAIVGAQPADGFDAWADAFPGWRELVAELWPELAQMTVRLVPDGGSANNGEIAVTITDQVTDAAALAFHTRTLFGAVQCVVERQQCRKYGVGLGPAAAHEIGESGINPQLGRSITAPVGSDPTPKKLPYEIADPVTSGIVMVNGVAFTNLTGPLFWIPGSPAGSRFDLLGEATAPLPAIPRGGAIEDSTGELEYGDAVTPELAAYLTEKRGRRWALKRGLAVVA